MPNTFLTPDDIAQEALALLTSNMTIARLVSRRYEANLNPGAKRGESVRLRRRGEGVVDEYNGSTVTTRDIVESSISMRLEKHYDATIAVTSRDMTMKIVDFGEQVMMPRIVAMAEKIDQYILAKAQYLPNMLGPSASAPGNIPGTIAEWALVEKSLNDLKIPLAPRRGVVSTEQKATILSQPSFVEVDKSGTDAALRTAAIGRILGLDMFMGQNVPTSTFTSGSMTSCAVNAAGGLPAGTTSIPFDTANGAAVTLKVGDIVIIAGYGPAVVAGPGGTAINDVAVTASSNAGTFTIKEPLRSAVADNAGITVYDGGGNARQHHGSLFHPDALAFVAVPLELPMGARGAYIRDEANNVALRVVMDYDRNLKSDVISIDCLVGADVVDGRLGGQLIKNI